MDQLQKAPGLGLWYIRILSCVRGHSGCLFGPCIILSTFTSFTPCFGSASATTTRSNSGFEGSDKLIAECGLAINGTLFDRTYMFLALIHVRS